jgi:hypothetical protein
MLFFSVILDWWGQFLPDGDPNFLMRLEHGAKMVLLMDILRECEILGDKVSAYKLIRFFS